MQEETVIIKEELDIDDTKIKLELDEGDNEPTLELSCGKYNCWLAFACLHMIFSMCVCVCASVSMCCAFFNYALYR